MNWVDHMWTAVTRPPVVLGLLTYWFCWVIFMHVIGASLW